MDEPITYPTWSDVSIPPIMVDAVRHLNQGQVLDYLILNRLFRFQIKAQYVYTCQKCGHQKRLSRNYESYLECERCKSEMISSTANWRMGKDRVKPYSQPNSDISVRKIVQQMSTVFGQYFRDYPPEDFVKCDWVLNRDAIPLPQEGSVWGQYTNGAQPDLPSDMPCFSAQFCCGEKVVAATERLSICKAAVLCPFLWDDCFDWKYLSPRDKGRETHLLPLLNIWAKLEDDGSSLPKWMASKMTTRQKDDPYMGGEPPPQGCAENEVPAAVMEVLKQEPNLLVDILGN